jgi:hypothetical protein
MMSQGNFELNTGKSETKGFASAVLPALLLVLGIALVFGMSRPAVAGAILDEPILGGQLLVVEDGEVWAKFLGSDAGYFNTLFLDGSETGLFDKSSTVNDEVLLGSFKAGTELVFRIDVTQTQRSFFSGDPRRNLDGLAHALAVTTFDEVTQTYITTVGFEDLFGGGDKDYNDFMFQLTNVVDPPAVPVPSVLALLVVGLAGLGYQRGEQIEAA